MPHAMKLNESDQVWMPEDRPEYLLVFPKGHRLPKTREQFLQAQSVMCRRLADEANAGEKADAARRLRLELAPEFLDWLPADLFDNPATPGRLLLNPAVEGSPLHEWKVDVDEVLNMKMSSPEEANREAEQLNLESFVSRLL